MYVIQAAIVAASWNNLSEIPEIVRVKNVMILYP